MLPLFTAIGYTLFFMCNRAPTIQSVTGCLNEDDVGGHIRGCDRNGTVLTLSGDNFGPPGAQVCNEPVFIFNWFDETKTGDNV